MTKKSSSLETDAPKATRRCVYSESKFIFKFINRGIYYNFRGGIAVVWLGQRIKPSLNGHGPVGGYVAMK